MKNFKALLLLLAVVIGCDHDETMDVKEPGDYFPHQLGIYQIYQVHEKNYSSGGAVQENIYELMAEVTDSFPSVNGLYTYVVHRSKRSTPDEPWVSLDTWSVRPSGSEFVVTEGNTPYIKLALPYSADRRWNGNAYNTLGEDEYAYSAVDAPQVVNGMAFERTVEVLQEANDDRIVFRDERKEVYAAGVGLVYKKVIQHNYCTDDACLGQQKIENGVEISLVINEYGKR